MKKSLGLKNLKNIDKSNMMNILLDFPLQCKTAQGLAESVRILFEKRDFSRIVFVGLGGSAIGADIVKSYLYFESKIPISVFREYDLPAFVDNSTLVFILSYSGNTEEILNAYLIAKNKGAIIVAISSNGKLRDSADRDKVTFIEIPLGLPPRCAWGYLSIIPLCILAKLGLVKDARLYINQMITALEDLRNNCLNIHIGQKDNIAKFIASKLFNKLAVIYSSSVNFDVCVTSLRSQLNENSKSLALSNFFPEMNHNEIVGWRNPKKIFKDLVVLMLRDKDMHPRLIKRIDITKEIIKAEGVNIIEIWSRGQDLLSRIFSFMYIGDFISYYLAILYGIDPIPIDRIAYLKQKLAECG